MERTDTATLAAQILPLARKRQRTALDAAEAGRYDRLLDALIEHLGQRPESERRRFIRVPAELEATFKVGKATITCGASELSLGGLSLRGHLWVLEEDELVLENLRVGNRDYPMVVRAKVVWKVSNEDEQPRAGLQFIEVDTTAERQIAAVFDHVFLGLLERLAGGEVLGRR